jgi:hypothetical protein
MGKTQVADCCFEFLHFELVDYIYKTSPYKDSKEKAYIVLENLGFGVGQRLAARLSKDRSRFVDNLDIIKFVCKELWMELFRKQIDNLRTNYKGTYVLNDAKFKFFQKISGVESKETTEFAKQHVVYTCGIIRGALNVLGIETIVTGDIQVIPSCQFKIQEQTK